MLKKPGYHSLKWTRVDEKGKKVSAGVYFVILNDAEKTYTEKLIIID